MAEDQPGMMADGSKPEFRPGVLHACHLLLCLLIANDASILISQVQNELPDSIIRQELDSVKAGVCML